METIRKVVSLGSDRQLEIRLPDTVEPGLVEVVVVVQSLSQLTDVSVTEGIELAKSDFSDYLSNLQDYEERLARGEIQW